MTPRPLDRDALQAKLALLRELLDDLEQLGPTTAAELGHDRIRRCAAERILTQLVEMAVAVNSHIAAATLGKGPRDYRESFVLASQCGAIPADLAEELRPSVGLRKVLTHAYATIDLAVVARSIPMALSGYRQFVREVPGRDVTATKYRALLCLLPGRVLRAWDLSGRSGGFR